jgi:single-stranded-DNA-specific exonuclease
LAAACEVPRAVAQVLVARGLADAERARAFLAPRLSALRDPFELPDMARATERIARAVAAREPIVVYGDYDVDGLTGSALLLQVLERLGAVVHPCLPNRLADGFGFHTRVVEPVLAAAGGRLVVTADCGMEAPEATFQGLAARGVDVIVTDHHEPGPTTAGAFAYVNPKRGSCPSTHWLAGVGVAFKLCHALVKRAQERSDPAATGLDLREYLDLVAVGTVADVVPLRDENRTLAAHGIAQLNRCPRRGLEALMRVAGLRGPVRAGQIGFVLGPRLNAAGRLGDARRALELLVGRTDRLERIAAELDSENQQRRQVEQETVEAARRELDERFDAGRDFGLVVAGQGWHVGVVGIVAARLVQCYGRPAIVAGFGEDGVGRGSCRGIRGFDLVRALEECADLLDGYGGHAMAAGLSLRRESVAAFAERFNAVCARELAGRDLRPVQRVDAWLEPATELDAELVEAVEKLEPFGEGNPEPVWGLRSVRVAAPPRTVGENHLRLRLEAGGRGWDAIGFGMAGRPVPEGRLDVALKVRRNARPEFGPLALHLEDFRPAAAGGG